MRLLLDSHVIYWSMFQTAKLSKGLKETLRRSHPVVSAATFCELAIKKAAGKIELIDDFPDRALEYGVEILPVRVEHAWRLASLPRLHGDPFDRLIVAQAQCEGLTLVTHDARMVDYGIPVIRA